MAQCRQIALSFQQEQKSERAGSVLDRLLSDGEEQIVHTPVSQVAKAKKRLK